MDESLLKETGKCCIAHIALYCNDLEAMRQFFIDYFAATSGEQYHNPRTGLRTYMLSFGNDGAQLEIMTRPVLVGGNAAEARIGYAHLSLSVGSKGRVDTLTEQLSTDGYEVASGPRVTGDGFYESCVVGPENILIEITI